MRLDRLTTSELLKYVDRTNPEVKELCVRLEELRALIIRHNSFDLDTPEEVNRETFEENHEP